MEILLTLFAQLSDKQFATAGRFFVSDKRAELVARFYDYCANCAQRVFDTGDYKHANKMAGAAEICGFGPTFRRVVVPNIPFAYDMEAHLFVGKIQKGKRSTLETLDANGIPNWEADMRERLDSEGQPREKKEPDYAKRLATALSNALKNGITAAEVRIVVNSAIKAAVSEVEVQKVAKGQAQEKADIVAEAKVAEAA